MIAGNSLFLRRSKVLSLLTPFPTDPPQEMLLCSYCLEMAPLSSVLVKFLVLMKPRSLSSFSVPNMPNSVLVPSVVVLKVLNHMENSVSQYPQRIHSR